MNDIKLIKLLKELIGEDVMYNAVCRELQIIYDRGNPTTEYCKNLEELRKLLVEGKQ